MSNLVPFFYDGQIERFLTQFMRMVSNFQVKMGVGPLPSAQNPNPTTQAYLQRVPVIYGDPSRQAAAILQQNSENVTPTVPCMAVYITNLEYARDRVQAPSYVGKMQLRERAYDPATGEYGHGQGDAYSIERLMPVPYKMSLKLDIWTSNTLQKLQILEQLTLLFNPDFEIQSTDNYVDWTSLSTVFLDSTNWTSRTVPMGSDQNIDIASMTFNIPIWISAPIKVKKLGVIQKIIATIYDESGGIDPSIIPDGAVMMRQVVTPLGYDVLLTSVTSGATKTWYLQLMTTADGVAVDPATGAVSKNNRESTVESWHPTIDIYGKMQPGITQIRLARADGTGDIVGTIAYNPADDTMLIYNIDVDTIPNDTLPPIDAIINPQNVDVDSMHLMSPTVGTRYLLTEPIGDYGNTYGPVAWLGANGVDLIAQANDIVQFVNNGSQSYWQVVLDAVQHTNVEYVTNKTTGIQYTLSNHEWSRSVVGLYGAEAWSIVI